MYSKLGQSSKMKLFAKIVTGFQPLTLFYKKLHPRCMTGFWITLLRKPMFKYSNKNNNRYIPVRSYFVYLLCAYPVSAGNTLFQRTVFETNSSNNADQCQIFISTFFLLFLPFQKFPKKFSKISLYKTFSNPPHFIDFFTISLSSHFGFKICLKPW